MTLYGESLEGWAATLLENYDYETGWSAAREWQLSHGPLKPGDRLVPKRPFILGGSYEADNLVAMDGAQAMRKLASLYHQVRDVADGSTLTVKDWI
jgi:hypothetical protein